MKANYRILIILSIALAIRLYFALNCKSVPDFSDMALYNQLAMENPLSTSPPPGYPLFLRLIYTIFGAYNYQAVFIAQSLLSILTVYLIYRTTRALSTELSALIAAGISAIYPNMIMYNLTTLSESLSILMVMFLFLVLVSEFTEKRRSIFAAVIICLSFFIRPALAFFWPGTFFSVKRKRVFIIASAVIMIPWFSLGLISGKSSNRGALGFYKSYNPKATGSRHYEMEDTELGSRDLSSVEYIRGGADFVKNNRWKTLDIIYNKASLLISRGWDTFVLSDLIGENKHWNNIMRYAYLPVMFLGIIGIIRLYDERTRVIVLPSISYVLLIVLIWIFKVRYRFLIEPTLIIFASMLVGKSLQSVRFPRLNLNPIKR